MLLGVCKDGRQLEYDHRLYEFRVGGEAVAYSLVRSLDDKAFIHWGALEQRDWFRRIKESDLKRCAKAARAATANSDIPLNAHDQVLADAARDDGVLAGKLVQADPALVQAVADELEKRGALHKGAPANPLSDMELPDGMEALSQMERAREGKRRMTRTEKRLMKKILRNDDKEKAKRERAGAAAHAHAGSDSLQESAEAARSNGAQHKEGDVA